MTTVTRRYALYQAQQGAYITDLEQLQASISLPSTIKMVFSLRKFTKFSIGLVFLWSFYYLGSQASKREYAYSVSNRFQPMTAVYPAFNTSDYFDTGLSTYGAKLNRDFISSLWGSDAAKLPTFGIDDNGNILLPDPSFLYMLFPNGTVNRTDVSKIRPSGTTYLTFSGRPLWTREEYHLQYDNGTKYTYTTWTDQRIVGDYSLHTSYIKFHCIALDAFPVDRFPAGVQETRVVSLNITQSNSTQGVNSTSPQQLEFWERWSSNTTLYDDVGNNVSAPRIDGSDGGAIRITCDILEPRIDVDVHCTETACLTTKMSCPNVDPISLKTTIFSNITFATSFFNDILSAEGIPKSRNSEDWGDVTNYLRLFDSVIVGAGTGKINASEKQEALDYQTSWLETLVNTYVNLAEQTIFPYDEDIAPAGYELLKVHGAPWDPHYALFWEWIAIDYVSGFLLLAAAVASFWLRKHTLVPDIFGFVSSLTRDNPHFPVLPGASTLDGITRTRALRHVKVKVGDIGGPHGEVGRIGFVPVHPTIPTSGLSKHRKYV